MKVKFTKLIRLASSLLPALALLIGISTAGEACLSFYHQPEVPEELNQYRR